MSGRAWSMLAAALLVSLVGVVLHAQMGGALGPPSGAAASGGGGVTVGQAVSGGTASRLLFSDASGLVSNATPVAVTSSLDLTSGTLDVGGACTLDSTLAVAGQATFTRDPASTATSAATVRINPATSAANEVLLSVQDNGTDEFWVDKEGDAQLTGALRVDSTADIRGAISNGGSANCNSVTAGAGMLCTADSFMTPATTSGATGGYAALVRDTFTSRFRTVRDGAGSIGDFYASGSDSITLEVTTSGDTLRLSTTAGGTIVSNTSTDIAAGTALHEWRDSGVTNLLNSIDGVGTFQFHNSTAIPAGDCDADAEVGRIRRYAKDANNITLCGCQKVGSAFGWAAVITGGDCT